MKPATSRLPLFDTLRGVAMVLMAIYHFCFDLNNFGVIHQDMNRSEFWLDFRAVIMTLFMGLIGVGLYLGRADYAKRSYWMRLAKIAACAGLISIVTFFMFGNTWVFFGVLHFAFLVSLFGPLLIRVPWLCLPVGSAVVALPLYYRSLWWHRPGFIISGLSPWKPMTEDFAPLCPWLGVALLGIFVAYVARRCQEKSQEKWPEKWRENGQEKYQTRWATGEIRLLSRLGHHSLAFYMIHQVFLFPVAWLVSKLIG